MVKKKLTVTFGLYRTKGKRKFFSCFYVSHRICSHMHANDEKKRQMVFRDWPKTWSRNNSLYDKSKKFPHFWAKKKIESIFFILFGVKSDGIFATPFHYKNNKEPSFLNLILLSVKVKTNIGLKRIMLCFFVVLPLK